MQQHCSVPRQHCSNCAHSDEARRCARAERAARSQRAGRHRQRRQPRVCAALCAGRGAALHEQGLHQHLGRHVYRLKILHQEKPAALLGSATEASRGPPCCLWQTQQHTCSALRAASARLRELTAAARAGWTRIPATACCCGRKTRWTPWRTSWFGTSCHGCVRMGRRLLWTWAATLGAQRAPSARRLTRPPAGLSPSFQFNNLK